MVKYTLSHWHRLETTHSPTNMLCNCHHFLHTKGNCTLGRGWVWAPPCPPPNLVRDWASEGTTPVYIKWRLWHQPQKWRLWHCGTSPENGGCEYWFLSLSWFLLKMTPKYYIFLERGKPKHEYFSIGLLIFWHLGACRLLFCVKLDLKITFLEPWQIIYF